MCVCVCVCRQASYPLLRLFHRYTKKRSEAKPPPPPPLSSIWLKLTATADAKPIHDESILKMCIIYILFFFHTHSHAIARRVNVFWLLLSHGMGMCVDGTSMCSPATTLLNIARRCWCCRRRRCSGTVYGFAAFVCKQCLLSTMFSFVCSALSCCCFFFHSIFIVCWWCWSLLLLLLILSLSTLFILAHINTHASHTQMKWIFIYFLLLLPFAVLYVDFFRWSVFLGKFLFDLFSVSRRLQYIVHR